PGKEPPVNASRVAALLKSLGVAVTRRRGLGLAAGGALAALSGAAQAAPDAPSCRKANRSCSKTNRCCKGMACRKGRCIRVCTKACARTTPICCNGRCSPGIWRADSTIGSGPGTAPSQFQRPAGSALSADGATLLVADGDNQRIAVWTKTGASWTPQTTFGSGPGAGDTQFDYPMGVTLSPDGLSAYVSDTNNDRISIWSRPDVNSAAWTWAGKFGATGWGLGQLSRPCSLAFSSNGLTCWIADSFNSRVSIWNRPSAGSLTWSNQTVFGSFGSAANELNNPAGIAVVPGDRAVLMADLGNNRVSMWAYRGGAWAPQTTFGTIGIGPGQMQDPWSVALSPDGLVAWVAEYTNNRVSIWTRPDAASSAWTEQTTFGSGPGTAPNQFHYLTGLSVTPDGRTAYVSDLENNRLTVWQRGCQP
ncbi:MAG: beta-propeller fold lactonase family protein, partial [Thermomicrobiales bacterium]